QSLQHQIESVEQAVERIGSDELYGDDGRGTARKRGEERRQGERILRRLGLAAADVAHDGVDDIHVGDAAIVLLLERFEVVDFVHVRAPIIFFSFARARKAWTLTIVLLQPTSAAV